MFLSKCCSCKKNIERTLENFCNNKNTKDGLSNQCKPCAKLYRNNISKNKIYPSNSPESRTKYLLKNNKSINEQRRKNYALKNKTEIYKQNKEKLLNETIQQREIRLESSREHYLIHKKDINARHKIYRQINLDSILLRNRKRQLSLVGKNISQVEINKLLDKNDHRCFYCKISVQRGINLHIDHKTPLIRGGEHILENLIPSCATCNLRKGTKTAEEFFKKLGLI